MYFAVLTKKKILYFALTFALVLLISLTPALCGAVFAVKQQRLLPIYSVKTQEKKIAISFDCAWGTEYTDQLLSIMEKYSVKSTFFTVEFWAKKHPDYVAKIYNSGHEIGTHSSTHPYMSKLSEENITRELVSSSNAIYEITGAPVTLFRAPYGDYNDSLISVANGLGLYTIQWDVDSLDWKNLSKTQIFERVTTRVKNGSIVLFHNNGLHTAEAIELIIPNLIEKGFSFVKISDLIYKEDYYISHDGTQIKND